MVLRSFFLSSPLPVFSLFFEQGGPFPPFFYQKGRDNTFLPISFPSERRQLSPPRLPYVDDGKVETIRFLFHSAGRGFFLLKEGKGRPPTFSPFCVGREGNKRIPFPLNWRRGVGSSPSDLRGGPGCFLPHRRRKDCQEFFRSFFLR